jgi:propane monooxygenase reductase subunit
MASGKFIRYGCKNGGCGSCRLRVIEGDIEQRGSPFGLTEVDRAGGWVLACTAIPLSDCTVDVGEMELSAEEFEAGDRVRSYVCEVESKVALTDDIRVLRLRVTGPDAFKFVAGQFVNIKVPGTGASRSYSMSNAPSDREHIELIVKLMPGGVFSSYLESQLKIGDRVCVEGPHGQLKIRLSHRPIVAAAGGSGLAPMLSMLTDLAEKGNSRKVTFFFGARRLHDLYLVERLKELQRRMPSLDLVFSVFEGAPAGWEGETGHVTDALSKRMAHLDGHDAYLCGPPGMIDAARTLLVERGVRPKNIYLDAFVPSGDRAL